MSASFVINLQKESLMKNLFVYGTLKAGFSNHYLIADCNFLGKVKTSKKYPMVAPHYAFPYLIEKEGIGYHIEGELFSVDDNKLRLLDELEGVPEHYYRKSIEVIDVHENVVSAECYFVTNFKNFIDNEYLKNFENPFNEDGA